LIIGSTTGPIMPATELTLIPKPLTTVGYNSGANNEIITYDDEIPILPIQKNISIQWSSTKYCKEIT